MDNEIIIIDENQNEEIVPQIEGLTVTFSGKNNVVKVEKGTIFRSTRIILSNNCEVDIKKTDEYGIRNLSAEFSNYCKLKIGRNFRCVSLRISAQSESNLDVVIGENCMFASNVNIRPTDGHAIYDVNTLELLNKGEDIVIGDHVWSGLNTVFLKGANISDNSIVGANSVVNKKFDEKNVVIVGSPAKIVKRGINWTMEDPAQYQKKFEKLNKNKRINQLSSLGKSLAGDDIFSKKRRFDRVKSFFYISMKEDLNPRNIYRIFKARSEISSLDLFDEKYYLSKHPDVNYSNVNPLDHYLYHGWKEKRKPSRKFDGNYYLKRYPDVGKLGFNPLVHYVLYGKEEGRFTNHQAEINFSF